MRRLHALIATLALTASIALVATPAFAEDPSVPVASPEEATPGQEVTITGDIGDGPRSVLLEKEYKGTWYAWRPAITSGNDGSYTFTTTTAPPERRFRAVAPAEDGLDRVESPPVTIKEVPAPLAPAPVAVPATARPGQNVTVTGDIGDGPARPVVLQKEYKGVWYTWRPAEPSTADGTYSFSTTTAAPSRDFRAFAPAEGGRPAVTSETVTIAEVKESGTLTMVRPCDGNVCSSNVAEVTGQFTPADEGRGVELQYYSGSWKTKVSGLTQDADGKVETEMNLTGISRWAPRAYRLVAEGTGGSAPVNSVYTKFMPGPTALSSNVLRISVEGGTFPTSRSRDYKGTATVTEDGVVKADEVELDKFGVRGSSTAGYPKKPYKIKFEDGLPLLGMTKNKSWTMLANYLDQSFMREKVGLDVGRKLAPNIPWTPDSRYADVFVNGLYQGAYVVTEKVQIDGDKVNIDDEDGMIMEVDGHNPSSSSIKFLSPHSISMKFKDPDKRKLNDDGTPDDESVTTPKLKAIEARVKSLEYRLYSDSRRDQVDDYLDIPSAIDFYLVKEFTKDNDADFYRSHYYFWDQSVKSDGDPFGGPAFGEGKFYMGPAWDFDRSAGNVSDTDAAARYVASPTGWYLRGLGTDSGRKNYFTHWYVQLFKDPAFYPKVKARWAEIKDEFEAVATDDTADNKSAISVAAYNDRARWASEAKRYKQRGSFTDEVDYVTDWYEDRYNWMDYWLSR